jgi:hypothetical protein
MRIRQRVVSSARRFGTGHAFLPNRPGSAGFDTSCTKRAFELADSTRLAPTVPLKGRKHARVGADNGVSVIDWTPIPSRDSRAKSVGDEAA